MHLHIHLFVHYARFLGSARFLGGLALILFFFLFHVVSAKSVLASHMPHISKASHGLSGPREDSLQRVFSYENDVVLVAKYRNSSNCGVCIGNNYKGLRIHALEGLHDFLGQKIITYFTAGGSILDLGAGTGAMALRLHDMGFKVTAADIVPENYRLHTHIRFVEANFNENLSDIFDTRFDGIVASEIIEHLENPRMFLRNCHKLLSPGGRLIISTPNVDNPVSKASFIVHGNYQWFFDGDYETEGHITPLSQWLLKKCIAESGFKVLWEGSFGNPYESTQGWWKMRLFARMMQMVSNTEKNLNGEIFVAVLQEGVHE